MDLPTSIIALIGTLFGGGGLALTTKWVSRNKDKEDSASKFRDELRVEVIRLRGELSETERELDEWKSKYYALLQDGILFKQTLEREQMERGLTHGNSNEDNNDKPA